MSWILKGVLGWFVFVVLAIPALMYGIAYSLLDWGNTVLEMEPTKDYLYYLDLANKTGKVVYWGECPIHPDE